MNPLDFRARVLGAKNAFPHQVLVFRLPKPLLTIFFGFFDHGGLDAGIRCGV
jgi:hypothetical protein